jgi:hypothetical protein
MGIANILKLSGAQLLFTPSGKKYVGIGESTPHMKKLFRKTIGYMVVLPFVVASRFLTIFLGQEKCH